MVLHLLTQWEHLRLHSSIIIEMITDDADIGILVNMVMNSWQTFSRQNRHSGIDENFAFAITAGQYK